MRDNDPPADKSAATTEKTVTVNAYADPQTWGSTREFADALDASSDYHERRTRERTDYVAVVGDLEIELCKSVYRDLNAELNTGVNIGDASIEERTRTTTEHTRSPDDATKALADDFAETVPPLDGLERDTWNNHAWEDDDGNWKAIIRTYGIKPRRVLVHHDRRTPDARFEGDDRVLSAQWVISLGPATETQVAQWNDALTGPFTEYVARNSAIQKVRIADCVERTEKQGDCFDV